MDGIPFVNASDVDFGRPGPNNNDSPHGCRDKNCGNDTIQNPWVRGGSVSSHAFYDTGLNGERGQRASPLDLFGHPIPFSALWDPFSHRRPHQSMLPPCVALGDAETLQLTLGGQLGTKSSDIPPTAFVPLDCFKNGAALQDTAHVTPPPQILRVGGGIVRRVSLPLAIHLHQESPSCNLWFEIPASVVEGGPSAEEFLSAFPLSLNFENIRTLNISEFNVGLPPTDIISYVIPLSSIAEEDQAKASFFHEYMGVSITGKQLSRDSILSAATLAYQETYDSAMWVSTTVLERHKLSATSEEPLGFLSSIGPGEGVAMLNQDLVQAVSHTQWETIRHTIEASTRHWIAQNESN